MLWRRCLELNLGHHENSLYSGVLLNKVGLYIAKRRVQIAPSSEQRSPCSHPRQLDLSGYLLAQLLKSPRSFPSPRTLPP